MKTLEIILTELLDVAEFCKHENIAINARGIFGNSPLHIAAMTNDIESLTILLNNGADDAALGEDGLTPIQAASELGSAEAVQILQKWKDSKLHHIDGV